MWTALGILAVVLLVIFWRGPNPVWGGGTLGVIGGFICAVIYALIGRGFHWSIVGKFAVIAVLICGVEEVGLKLVRGQKPAVKIKGRKD